MPAKIVGIEILIVVKSADEAPTSGYVSEERSEGLTTAEIQRAVHAAVTEACPEVEG